MSKRRKIDFTLYENDYEKIIFRFYPRQSSCHSFGDDPPKSWSDVYKVYYYYRILIFCKEEDGSICRNYDVLFDADCDECSIIDEVSYVCSLLADGIEVYKREDGEEIQLLNKEMFPFGMGVSWTISKYIRSSYDWEEGESDIIYYTFMLFDYWNKGFKFTLKEKDIKAFGKYLNSCCEYMLEHGDPI